MEAFVNYGNLNYSSFIDRVVKKKLSRLEKKQGSLNQAELDIYLKNENPPQSAGEPKYKVVIELNTPVGQQVVEKKSRKFHRALSEAFRAVEKSMVKMKGKVLSSRNRKVKNDTLAQ